MPYSNSDAGVKVYTKTADGLALTGTIGSGVPPTTADIYAKGCELTSLSTAAKYVNVGTSAAPSWETN